MELLRCPEKYCFNLLWTDLVHGQDFVRPGGDVNDCSCGRRQARCCCQGCAPYFITNRNMIFFGGKKTVYLILEAKNAKKTVYLLMHLPKSFV